MKSAYASATSGACISSHRVSKLSVIAIGTLLHVPLVHLQKRFILVSAAEVISLVLLAVEISLSI